MRIVAQRVSRASVRVDGDTVAAIGPGFCVLVGVAPGDDREDVSAAADKLAGLRVFPNEEDRMNLSITDIAGEVLVVSQFTLLASVDRGRRPSFTGAAPPDEAAPLVSAMAESFRQRGISAVEGVFGARMEVELVNDGPVTLVLEARGGRVR